MIYISMSEMRRRDSRGITFHEVVVRPHGRPVPADEIHAWAGKNGKGDFAAICLTDYQSDQLERRYWAFFFTDPNEAFEFKMLWG
ncbi:MAG: hypothetical protein EOP83_01140 [Verrucomicrobiaceae bacterium]|nr:MAG: hypothetical protein EOP83_01140 [Verrucomicrobiaceae bacterium]